MLLFSDAELADKAGFIFISYIDNSPNPFNPRLKNENGFKCQSRAHARKKSLKHLCI